MFEVGQEVHGAGQATVKALLDAAQKRRREGWREEADTPSRALTWAVDSQHGVNRQKDG